MTKTGAQRIKEYRERQKNVIQELRESVDRMGRYIHMLTEEHKSAITLMRNQHSQHVNSLLDQINELKAKLEFSDKELLYYIKDYEFKRIRNKEVVRKFRAKSPSN